MGLSSPGHGVPILRRPAGRRVDASQQSNKKAISPSLAPAVNGRHRNVASPNLITVLYLHISASSDTTLVVVDMTHPAIRSGNAALTTIEVAQERFVEVP
jgi:hypothetical protein